MSIVTTFEVVRPKGSNNELLPSAFTNASTCGKLSSQLTKMFAETSACSSCDLHIYGCGLEPHRRITATEMRLGVEIRVGAHYLIPNTSRMQEDPFLMTIWDVVGKLLKDEATKFGEEYDIYIGARWRGETFSSTYPECPLNSLLPISFGMLGPDSHTLHPVSAHAAYEGNRPATRFCFPSPLPECSPAIPADHPVRRHEPFVGQS